MTYTHLSQYERYQIQRWLKQGLLIIQISRLLNRSKSTIYRELMLLNVAYSAQTLLFTDNNAPAVQQLIRLGLMLQLGKRSNSV
jgi:DNA-binding NarL/FixJ family response regulator